MGEIAWCLWQELSDNYGGQLRRRYFGGYEKPHQYAGTGTAQKLVIMSRWKNTDAEGTISDDK